MRNKTPVWPRRSNITKVDAINTLNLQSNFRYEIVQIKGGKTNFDFFFYQGFFSQTLTKYRTIEECRRPSLFLSTTSTHSENIQTFICTACNHQTTIRWDLLPWGVTIWLCDDRMLIFANLIILFQICYSYLTQENGGLERTLSINLLL